MSQPNIREFQMDFVSGGSQPLAASLYEDGLTINSNQLTICSFGVIYYENPTGQWIVSTPRNTITIPTGVTKAKITASLFYESSSADPNMIVILALRKNGSYVIDGRKYAGYGEGSTISSAVMNDDTAHILTPWIPVVAGDTFQLAAWHNYGFGFFYMRANDIRFQVEGM